MAGRIVTSPKTIATHVVAHWGADVRRVPTARAPSSYRIVRDSFLQQSPRSHRESFDHRRNVIVVIEAQFVAELVKDCGQQVHAERRVEG